MEIERRTVRLQDVELRKAADEQDAPEIRGYAAVFDALSEDLGGFRERIAPGAFAGSVAQNDIRALWEHNPQYVLGRNKAGTLHLEEDEQGLWITTNPPDTVWARDLMASMERGDVNQMSFGFYTRRDRWDRDEDTGETVRTLLDVDLFDVSVVTYPAYPQTSAEARDNATRLSQAAAADNDEAAKARLRARLAAKRRKVNILKEVAR